LELHVTIADRNRSS